MNYEKKGRQNKQVKRGEGRGGKEREKEIRKQEDPPAFRTSRHCVSNLR